MIKNRFQVKLQSRDFQTFLASAIVYIFLSRSLSITTVHRIRNKKKENGKSKKKLFNYVEIKLK